MSSAEPQARRPSLAFAAVAWLKKLALPPAGLLILACAGLWLPEPWRTVALVAGLGLLWIAATPLVGLWLLRGLERYPPLDPHRLAADPDRDAIVVLDAGRYQRIASRRAGEVKPETLERLRHAAMLGRRTALPVLATGDGAGSLMGVVLEEDFGVPARWLELESRNTQENADFSAAMLRRAGRRRVVLVTHAWHMARAARAFERTGLDVVPAPCAFAGPDRQELRLLSLVPSAGGLLSTWRALHEWIGLAWYALRHRRAPGPP